MSRPVVSVCIANFNGMEVIDACLASVFGQQGTIPLEVIVHDDASTDGSAAYIREQYPDVTLIESTENVGFCIANNRMAAQAQGEYLLLLNNDAALFSDALQTLLAEARSLGKPVILGLPQYDANSGDLIDRGCLIDPFLNPVPNLDPAKSEVGMVIGACLWLPKALWNELEGFPAWFGSIGEDLYLCCRARLAGYAVRVPLVSGYHHRVGWSFGGGKAQGSKLVTTFRRRALSEQNKTFVMALTYPAPVLLLVLPLHLGLLLLEGLLLALLRWDRAWLQEIYLPVFTVFWQQKKKLRRLREEIQQRRCVHLGEFFSVFGLMHHKLRMLLRHGLPELRR